MIPGANGAAATGGRVLQPKRVLDGQPPAGGDAKGGGPPNGDNYQQRRQVNGQANDNQHEDERQFIELVCKGDVDDVRQHLLGSPNLDINWIRNDGRTALICAIQERNIEMIRYLLRAKGLNLEDAIMHAVKTGSLELVDLIVNHIRRMGSADERLKLEFKPDTRFFNEFMQPLVLACIEGHQDIIGYLLEKGHALAKPHRLECYCEECRANRARRDALSDGCRRLNLYRAFCSPEYLCQIKGDRILIAFLLTKELEKCAEAERELSVEYTELSMAMRNYAAGLLSQCRTEAEVEQVLKRRAGFPDKGDAYYPRLSVALYDDQKEFVANPKCQVVQAHSWLRGWRNWNSTTSAWNFGRLLVHTVGYPLISAAYIFTPRCHPGPMKAVWYPYTKFLRNTAAYFLLLFLLYYQAIFKSKPTREKGQPFSAIQWYILACATGAVWQEYQSVWASGWRAYFKVWWHWADVICLTFGLSVTAFAVWAILDEGLKNVEVIRWHQWDPCLIEHALAPIMLVAAMRRLFYTLQLHKKLGPMIVSIGRCLLDLLLFLAILGVLLLSFSVALTFVYRSYAGQVQQRADGTTVWHPDKFISIDRSIRWLHWSIYGYTPPDFMTVVIGSIGGTPETPVFNDHAFTQKLGEALNGAYNFIQILVLLHLMVAVMSHTVNKILAKEDLEWKFIRSKIWTEYNSELSIQPPPFNLIPAIVPLVGFFLIWRHEETARWSFFDCFYDECGDDETQQEYTRLIDKLTKRYMASKSDANATTVVLDTVSEKLNTFKQAAEN